MLRLVQRGRLSRFMRTRRGGMIIHRTRPSAHLMTRFEHTHAHEKGEERQKGDYRGRIVATALVVGLGCGGSYLAWWNSNRERTRTILHEQFVDAVIHNKPNVLKEILSSRMINPNTIITRPHGAGAAILWAAALGHVDVYVQLKNCKANHMVRDASDAGVLELAARHSQWRFFDYVVESEGITAESYQNQYAVVPISTEHEQLIQHYEKEIEKWSKERNSSVSATGPPTSMYDIWKTLYGREEEETRVRRATYLFVEKMDAAQPIDATFFNEFAQLNRDYKRGALSKAFRDNLHHHLIFFMLQGAHVNERIDLSCETVQDNSHRLFAHLWLRHPTKTPEMLNYMFLDMVPHRAIYTPVLAWYLAHTSVNPVHKALEEMNSAWRNMENKIRFHNRCAWIYEVGGLHPFQDVNTNIAEADTMFKMIRRLPEIPKMRVIQRLKTKTVQT